MRGGKGGIREVSEKAVGSGRGRWWLEPEWWLWDGEKWAGLRYLRTQSLGEL